MRPTCSACARPLRVCLCAELPSQPIHTATNIVILQHPHETRHKLATVPILARCLSNCQVIVGRRLQLGTSKLLDACASSSRASSPLEQPSTSSPLSAQPSTPSPPFAQPLTSFPFAQPSPPSPPFERSPMASTPLRQPSTPYADESGGQCWSCGERKLVLLLFPSSDAIELGSWLSRRRNPQPDRANEGQRMEKKGEGEGCSAGVSAHTILLVVDGTWQHAREMVKASMPFLCTFVEQVCLPHDITREGLGMGDSESIMRKEPFAGCVSTMEAVARSLAILEPDVARIEQTLLSVLRQIVHLQAAHFAPMKPRPRLRKEPHRSADTASLLD